MLGSTENGARQSTSCCVVTTRGGGRGLSRPDLEITVCGVSEWERGTCPRSPQPQPPFSSLDWLLAAVRPRTFATAGSCPTSFASCWELTKPHKKVV